MRTALRLARTASHVLDGVAIVTVAFPFAGRERRARLMQGWSRRILAALGVELRAGIAPAGSCMFIANHVSWLDIIALAAVRPGSFIAKSELRRWPLVGRLASGAGTLFIERGRRRGIVGVNAQIARRLREGDSLVLFAEGTTTDGGTVLPFRSALLQPALDAGTPVHPVAISYRDRRDRRVDAAAYFGERSFLGSLRQVAAAPEIVAHLEFLDPVRSAGGERSAVAAAARDSIVAALTTRAVTQP